MKLLSLNDVVRLTEAKNVGGQIWYGFCPVHGDAHTPNLKIEPGKNGGAKVYCHPYRCEQKKIWAKLRAEAARKTNGTNEGTSVTAIQTNEGINMRSEERRVGKECRSRWS